MFQCRWRSSFSWVTNNLWLKNFSHDLSRYRDSSKYSTVRYGHHFKLTILVIEIRYVIQIKVSACLNRFVNDTERRIRVDDQIREKHWRLWTVRDRDTSLFAESVWYRPNVHEVVIPLITYRSTDYPIAERARVTIPILTYGWNRVTLFHVITVGTIRTRRIALESDIRWRDWT